MRIHVRHIGEVQADGVTIAFDSSLGSASARWVGELPDEGASCEVELEVPGVLTWGSEIADTLADESIFEEKGRVCLVGCVRSLSDDGVAAIQVGHDIVLVEIAGAPREVSRKVVIRVPEIKLFDTGL